MKGRLTVEVYEGGAREDGKTEHYWRITAPNGKTLADGGEGYGRRGDAKKAVKHLIAMIERGLINIEGEQGKVK